nr:FimD/PapC C-terminal domain-containing protein [Escherichia coli]
MTSLKTSIKTITYLSDTGCLEIQGASLEIMIGSMGQGGQAFVRGINDSGELIIRWFENSRTINCKLHYQLPAQPETLGSTNTLLLNNLTCKLVNH